MSQNPNPGRLLNRVRGLDSLTIPHPHRTGRLCFTVVVKTGRHFLQIPGPTNVPDRVLRALSQPTIDHRGPVFAALAREAFAGLQQVFQTKDAVIIYPSSGTGAWEAALVNTLSPGDRILMFET